MNTSYMTPYMTQQNILPPQQILQANGKASIDALRMSPNSSALIADSTAAIVWKCVSDSLGNVVAEPFDILPHKSEEQVAQDNLYTLISEINDRLTRLEENYEQSKQSIVGRNEKPHYSESKADKKNNASVPKPTSGTITNNAEQSEH